MTQTNVAILPPPTNRQRAVDAVQRSAAAIERLREIIPPLHSAPAPVATPAKQIAAVVGATVDAVVQRAAGYGGQSFEASADIEHVEPGGATTRARISFRYGGRNG
jgi:hypothetical protein